MSGKIITIAHQKGGVGKSTISSNLLIEFSKLTDVSILDLDVQQSLTAFITSRKNNNLSCNFNLLKNPANSQELINIMDNLKNGLLIIDTGGFDVDIQRIAIYGADMVITPVGDSSMELHGLAVFSKTIQKLKEIKQDIKAHIIFNRVHAFASKSLDELAKEIKKIDTFTFLETILRDSKSYKDAYHVGKSVVELDSSSKTAKEIIRLVDEIKQILSI